MGFWADVGNNLASCATLAIGGLFVVGAVIALFFANNTILAIILFVIGIVILAMSAAFSKKARR